MPERLLQLAFDEQLKPGVPKDVTPKDFQGLAFEEYGEIRVPKPDVGRFVREVGGVDRIKSPEAAAEYLMKNIFTPFEDFDQEEMWVLLMNTKNFVTHEVMVYRGVVDSVYVRQAELLKEAVRQNAPALVISHVHPSGDPHPSPADIRLTAKTIEAGRILDVELLDHIIVGNDAWFSMKEMGVGFD